MRDYELTVVIRTDIDEKSRDEIIERVVGWIPLADGAEPEIDRWGRRKLAYPIEKQTEGYYVFITVEMDPDGITELERNILYTDEILRHLVVRKEG